MSTVYMEVNLNSHVYVLNNIKTIPMNNILTSIFVCYWGKRKE